MKKVISAVITGSLLLALSACSSAPEVTTEEATTTTTESETTTMVTTTTEETTAEPTYSFAPEEYSRVYIDSAGPELPADLASDFDYGSNAIYEIWYDEANDTAWPCAPNYPAGEDIVITFKSKEDYFDFGSILRVDPNVDMNLAEFDPSTLAIASMQSTHNANTDEWTYSSNITDYLKYDDGTYTLTIPAEYVETGYNFQIKLTTEPFGFTGEGVARGSTVDIIIRCMEPLE